MSKSTKVFVETFKGHAICGVWNVDENGQKIGKYPIVSMGLKKSIAVLEHQDAITNFIKEQIAAAKEG